MNGYMIRRLLLVIPTLFFTTLIIFFMIRLIPGSIIDQMVSEGEVMTQMNREAYLRELGLDKPIHEQYFIWMKDIIVRGDLGDSFWRKSPVMQEIRTLMPATFELGLIALITSLIIALPVGVIAAIRQDTIIDHIVRGIATMGISIPSFFLGIMVVVFPAIWWGYSPALSYIKINEDFWGNLAQFIIPGVVLGIGMTGVCMRLMRNSMLEVLRQDYIRTAWSKGLTERIIVIRHAVRNSIIPVITLIGAELGVLIGGAVITEQIFNIPGIGRLFVDAAFHRDYPVITGVMLVISLFTLVMNVLVDMTYSWLDPRIRY